MKRLKVMTVVGTRPEIIRLSRVIPVLDEHTEHVLVHTGQNYDYELNQVFFDDLGLRKPDHFLEAAGATAADTIGKIIIEIDRVLERERPDAMLILGDTNSCLSVIPAKRRRIPTFHMEAGNRCFDMRVPEEINRRIIDHTADINLPYSDIAREYLLAEGVAPDRIVKTGSPMFEVLQHYRAKIDASKIHDDLGVAKGEYFLVSAHREENVDPEIQLRRLHATLNMIAQRYDCPILVSTHPRTRKQIESHNLTFDRRIELLRPFGFFDYNSLQLGARVVLSDSGTISEESSILGFPAINIREAHERPEGMEEGVAMMVGLECERVIQAIDILSKGEPEASQSMRLVEDYAQPNVSQIVLRIIMSYTDYVKRTVWRENVY